MKYLFVSLDGLIADIAWSVVKEGHDVKFYIHDSHEKEIADGFVPKTNDWQADVDWADLVVFDDVLGQGTHAHRLRKTGKLVVGGTLHGPTGRRPRIRPEGAQECRCLHYSAGKFHVVRRCDQVRRIESGTLRHQTQR
jgi:hypothetical protein